MKSVDIMECLVGAIEKVIYEEWKHEGFIGGFTSEKINADIDGKEYVICIKEVEENSHWSEVKETSRWPESVIARIDESNEE